MTDPTFDQTISSVTIRVIPMQKYDTILIFKGYDWSLRVK